MVEKTFGSCCDDLNEALKFGETRKSFFRIEENGVLYLTFGYVSMPEGTGWFDQAVLFCPFCGKQLQNKSEITKS